MILLLWSCQPDPAEPPLTECETVDLECRSDGKDLIQSCCETGDTETTCWYDTPGDGHYPCDGDKCGTALSRVIDGLCTVS